MKKREPKPAPAATLRIYGDKGLIETRRVKAWYGPAPKRARTLEPRKRRKSA